MTPAEVRGWAQLLGGPEAPLGLRQGALAEALEVLKALRARLHLTYGQRRALEDVEGLLWGLLQEEQPWE